MAGFQVTIYGRFWVTAEVTIRAQRSIDLVPVFVGKLLRGALLLALRR